MLYKVDAWLGRLAEESRDWSWALMRVLVSAMFMTHGYSKLFGDNPQPVTSGGMTTVNIGDMIVFPMPLDLNALWIAGVIELFGGALLVVGLWTHLMALFALLLMFMAYATAHLAWFPTLNNGELAAMYFLAYLILFTFGAGQFSADAWLAERRQERRRNKIDAMQSG